MIVDIRALRQHGRALQNGPAETLKYPFKPTNLWDWGPAQVAQFNELTRMKLSECYGALRGLAGVLDDGEDQLGREPEEALPDVGDPCPLCGLPLVRVRIARGDLAVKHPGSTPTTTPSLSYHPYVLGLLRWSGILFAEARVYLLVCERS